nr:hypothetical protein [Tanacetum cinerariifolium]
MEILSDVLDYLNNLENLLNDDGDSMARAEQMVEKGKAELILEKLGFVRIEYGEYGRKMVKDLKVEIHGFTFLVDFVVLEYEDTNKMLVMFRRNFLVTTKCQVNFGLGEIDITMLKECQDLDFLLDNLFLHMEKVVGVIVMSY